MGESPAPSQVVDRHRPTGVWILTIYVLIVAGILPLLFEMYLLFSGDAAGNEIGALLSIPISIGVIISAIGAWRGNERARMALLALVTLHYVLIAINNYVLLSSGQVPEAEVTRMWVRILRDILYPAAYIWYFNLPTTKEFYK